MKQSTSIALAAVLLLLGLTSVARADAPPNAAKMQVLNHLVGTWNCSWHAGTASGEILSTFTPVMNGAWIQQTESTKDKNGNPVITTMHYSGYDPSLKMFVHMGPNADGTYEVAYSKDFRIFHNVHPEGMTESATLVEISSTEYTLSEPFTEKGKRQVYVDRCSKN
jgi:hypothetical protein